MSSSSAPIDPIINTDQSAPSWAPRNVSRGTEQLQEADAQATGFSETIKRSFLYGDNYGVQIVKDIMRKGENGGVDPEFNQGKFIEQNKDRIDATQQWRYMLAGNQDEATSLLRDSEEQTREQTILEQRGGFSTFVARGLTGLVDVDAPIGLVTGGLSAGARLGLNATRFGRMVSGAVGSGLSVGVAAEAGYLANPTEDWTSVPLAGLMGMGFGVLGGAVSSGPKSLHVGEKVSERANTGLAKLTNEFGEYVNDGTPLAKSDIRTEVHSDGDSWGNRAKREPQEAPGEALGGSIDAGAPEPVKAAGEAPGASAGPKVFRLSDVKPQGEAYPEGWVIQDGSVGAAQQPAGGPGINTVNSSRSKDIIRSADTWAKSSGVTDKWYENFSNIDNVRPEVAAAAKRFHDVVTASGLVTDFGRLMRTGSTVAQKVAYDLFENSTGIIRNNRSAAALMEHYHKDMSSHIIPVDDAFKEWSVRNKQAGIWDRVTNPQLRHEFNELLTAEMQARKYDNPNTPRPVDPAIAKAADELDAFSAKDIEISQGRPGEGTRVGYENMTPESGYMPQKWDGRKIEKIITERGPKGVKDVIDAVTSGYKLMHPHVDPKDLRVWATAVVDRARRSNEGVSSSLIGILQADGREALSDALRRNGIADIEITRLIDTLTGSMEQRQKASHLKQRVDIDMRHTDTNGIRIMDMMDTDIIKIMSMRSKQTAGQSALARKGILSKADWEEIKTAILDQQSANGQSVKSGTELRDKVGDLIDSDKHTTAEILDHMYSYFGSGPAAGGTSPIVSRMKKITNLATLNQLGLAQFAEFGPMIGAVGWKRFSELAGAEIMDALRNAESPLVKELRHLNVLVPEERIFRDDLTFEHEKFNSSAGELAQKFDNMLNKGQRIQGYTSGFYAMRNIQQRIAVTSSADRIMREMKDGFKGNVMSMDRLADAGFDKALLHRVMGYANGTVNRQNATFKNSVVEFTRDGDLKRLNLHQWEPRDAEDFILSLNRVTNQLVQKAMAGESSVLFHKDGVAALFFHLKAFPMQAMEKQAYRTLRMADQEGAMTFMYGLATAGAAYVIKNIGNQRDDNLSAAKVAAGAFNMSNMTGWIPMWTDPLAGMLGMDDLRFNHYANARGSAPIFSAPASYETLNRMIALPGAVQHVARGVASTSDVRTLQSIPLIGNAYGMTAMFNKFKEVVKEGNKQRKADERAQKRIDAGPKATDKIAPSTIEGMQRIIARNETTVDAQESLLNN